MMGISMAFEDECCSTAARSHARSSSSAPASCWQCAIFHAIMHGSVLSHTKLPPRHALWLQDARSREKKLQTDLANQETTKFQIEAMLTLKRGQAQEAKHAAELQEVPPLPCIHSLTADSGSHGWASSFGPGRVMHMQQTCVTVEARSNLGSPVPEHVAMDAAHLAVQILPAMLAQHAS